MKKVIPHLYAEQSLYRALYWRGTKDQEREAKAFAQCVANRWFLEPPKKLRILEVLSGTQLHKEKVLWELHNLMPDTEIEYVQGDAIDGEPTDFVAGTGSLIEQRFDVIAGFFMSFNSFLDIENGYRAGSDPIVKALNTLLNMLEENPTSFIWLDVSAYGSESGVSSVLESRTGGLIKPGPQSWQVTCTTAKLDIFRDLLARHVNLKETFGVEVTPENKDAVEIAFAKTLTLAVSCSSEFDRRTGVVSDRYHYVELFSSLRPASQGPLVEWKVTNPFEIIYVSEAHAALLAQQAYVPFDGINFGVIDKDNKFTMLTAKIDQSASGILRDMTPAPNAKPVELDSHTIFCKTVPDVLILSNPETADTD